MVDISVIVPVFNAEKNLDRCLRSLCLQAKKNLEIIIVDDGSTDSSYKIIQTYKSRYPDIIRAYSTENQGVWKARQYALRKAEGEFVGFCDSDDYIHADMYEKMYQRAQIDGSEMVVCAYERVYQSGESSKEMVLFGDRVIETKQELGLLPVINTALWNKLIKRTKLCDLVDFDQPPRIAEDMMFLASIYPHLGNISFICEPLYFYQVYDSSAMQKITEKDILLTENAMLRTKDFLIQQGIESRYLNALDLMAFIHIGISLPVGVARDSAKNQSNMIREVIRYLDDNFCTWRKSPFLKRRYFIPRRRYLWKIFLVNVMYRLRLMSIFLRLYSFAVRKMRFKIKW